MFDFTSRSRPLARTPNADARKLARRPKLGLLDFGYPLNPATKSKSNHRFVPQFFTQPTVQYGSKEENLQGTLADFKASKFEFGSEAARAYDVPSSTFSDRLNSKKPRHQHQQRLTPTRNSGDTKPLGRAWVLLNGILASNPYSPDQ